VFHLTLPLNFEYIKEHRQKNPAVWAIENKTNLGRAEAASESKNALDAMARPCGRNHAVPRNDPFTLSTFQYVFSTPVWPLSHLRALQAASCRDASHRSLRKLFS
jgi:hypothetical protein